MTYRDEAHSMTFRNGWSTSDNTAMRALVSANASSPFAFLFVRANSKSVAMYVCVVRVGCVSAVCSGLESLPMKNQLEDAGVNARSAR